MKIFLLFSSFVLFIQACEIKESKIAFEEKVLTEVFPEMMDSLWVRNSTLDVLPNIKLDKKGNVIGLEEKSKQEILLSHRNILTKLKLKNDKIYAILLDSFRMADGVSVNRALKDYFKDAVVVKDVEIDSVEYSVDKKIFANCKYAKIELIDRYDYWEMPEYRKLGYNFDGVISFSKVYFDSDKKHGFLSCSINCGAQCGRGYQIFLKKNKDKWTVAKVIETWIA